MTKGAVSGRAVCDGMDLRADGVVRHLYVHIPFCPQVCPYCSFYKEASDANKTTAFLDALLEEARRVAGLIPLRPETVFFGGGTPTALGVGQLEYLLDGLRGILDFGGVVEWTMEMNPATVSAGKARLLRDFGVTRVSMGVQSWDPGLLRVLGRVHTAGQAEESYALLRRAGFDAVSLDLIFAIPGQSDHQWEETLERTVALGPDHVSAYCLTFEEDTEFMRRHLDGEFAVDEEWEARLHELGRARLSAAGYPSYETSNFAPPGRECRHNLAYWRGADYAGLGPSAFSTLDGRRVRNVPDTSAYIRRIAAGVSPVDFSEEIDAGTRRRERIAFGLRLSEGIPSGLVADRRDEVESLIGHGLLAERDGRIRVTARGALLADGIAASLI